MEKTRARRTRTEAHARHYARKALEVGTATAIGRALGISRSRISHWRTDEVHPDLYQAMVLLLTVAEHPGLDPLPMLDALSDALECGALIRCDDAQLLRDGLALLERECERDGDEDCDGLVGGLTHADGLGRYRRVARRLELTIREAAARGIDLHGAFRARAVAS